VIAFVITKFPTNAFDEPKKEKARCRVGRKCKQKKEKREKRENREKKKDERITHHCFKCVADH
jgi:hypothetical protein